MVTGSIDAGTLSEAFGMLEAKTIFPEELQIRKGDWETFNRDATFLKEDGLWGAKVTFDQTLKKREARVAGDGKAVTIRFDPA